MMLRALVGVAALNAAFACFTLEGVQVAGDASQGANFDKSTLRMEGDIWKMGMGCNRLPCGQILNDETAHQRMTVSANAQGIQIHAKLQKFKDDGGVFEYSLKYGDKPHFSATPGFTLGNIVVKAGSDLEDIYKTVKIPDPKFTYNATIQVSYSTDGFHRNSKPYEGIQVHPAHNADTTATFYQCIDISITDGQPYDPSKYPYGYGPNENSAPPLQTFSGAPVRKTGLPPFWIAFIILMILILCCCIIILVWWKTRPPKEEAVFEPHVYKQAQPPPELPAKEKTPTPVEDPEPAENYQQFHYDDAPPPVEKPKTPEPVEGPGSQGRHFHFRYVGEDDKV